jgi:3-methyl-2-oxobutanoate hydroxymethyltransferase
MEKGQVAQKKRVQDSFRMKESGGKNAYLTHYNYPSAYFAEKARIDMLLVGDSLVIQGLSF